ncbi:MAG: phage terminase large subunit family protein [Sneathiellaceae bacterium]
MLLASAARLSTEAMIQVLTPPDEVDYLRWARENIVFSERESQFPGAYDADLFPFFSEPLAALSPEDPCRVVTMHKSAQLGGTVLATIFVLGSQDMDPCDLLYVHPTEPNAVRWSKLKLKPMLRGTTTLRGVFPEKSRDGGDSILFKERVDGRGSIVIGGANSAASLSMISVPRQVQDDLSKWENNSAGDPEQQSDSRSRGYLFAKIFKISTPGVVPGCRITAAYETGTQEKFHVPCPHCGHEHVLEWENFVSNIDADHPERACFTCPACGAEIQEHHRAAMVRGGRWIAEHPERAATHRSFHLWSAYGPLQSWSLIASEWLAAQGDPERERVVLNDTAGEAFHFKGDAPAWEVLRDRAGESHYPRGTVPASGLVLTMGLDCQADRVEGQVVAWGREKRRWVVDYIIVSGHISEAETQAQLDRYMAQGWRTEDGGLLHLHRVAIDGNAWTEDVWDWAKRHPVSRLIMMRGANSEHAPLLVRVKRETNRKGRKLPWSKRFFNVGVSTLKMGLYLRLAKVDPLAEGYVGLPRGLEDEYFRQLTAERRVVEKDKHGFARPVWKKDADQANEALDTMNQAEAAAINFGVRSMPETIWQQLEAERGAATGPAQLDLEELPAGGRVAKQDPGPVPPSPAGPPEGRGEEVPTSPRLPERQSGFLPATGGFLGPTGGYLGRR